MPASNSKFIPTPSAVGKLLLIICLAFLGTVASAAWIYESEPHFKVRATPKVVNEGDVVNFEVYDMKYFDHELERNFIVPSDVHHLFWDFGMGIKDSALGLKTISHRFVDGANAPQTVTVRHIKEEQSITVEVKNVKPKIYRMWHSTPVVKGQPVKFHAIATDPGVIDTLTFKWDFGDGSTATGQNVEHKFSGTGDYQVTLKVDDGIDFDIKAMDVDLSSSNTFSVSGDVSLPNLEIDELIVAASTANPMAQNPTGACQIRLQMGNREKNSAITLTANLDPGFRPGKYAIGETTEWDGSHLDDAAAQGTFFADLGLDRDIAYRVNQSGQLVGGPMWSEDGEVTIHKFEGDQLELSFWTNLVEIIPVEQNPRVVRVEGHLSTRVERSQGGVLKGLGDVFSASFQAMNDPDAPSTFEGANFYLCGDGEPGTFDIASWNPFNNEVGVAHQEPQIEVTFTEQVDPETLADNAHLELRAKNGFRAIQGGWEVTPEDPKTIRFIPKSDLFPAVIYCLRIDADQNGLRSTNGDLLVGTNSHDFSKAMKPACENKDSAAYGSNTRRAAFSTRVEFTHSRVDVYQSSLVTGDTDLVPGKPALARVYAHWPDFGLTHPSATVKEIEAKVTVTGNTSLPYQPKEVKIRQPDRYTPLQRKNAENSVNFFGWRPGTGSGETQLQAVIEQLDQNGITIDPGHTSLKNAMSTWPHDDDFKKLTVQPFLILYPGNCPDLPSQDCDWTDGVSDDWKSMAQTKLADALEFTTQNFPFLSAVSVGDQSGIPTVDVTPPDSPQECSLDGWDGFYCYNVGTQNEVPISEYVGDLMFDQAGSSEADILLGIVPPDFFVPGAVIGLWTYDSQDRPLVYAQLDEANAATIAHEFGHFFTLEHCPQGTADGPCFQTPIQAYRLNLSGQSGNNKHMIEGNQQGPRLDPLMHPSERPVNNQFSTVSQYRTLMTGIHDFRKTKPTASDSAHVTPESFWLADLLLPESAFAQSKGSSGGQQLAVSGSVRNGQVHIDRIRSIPVAGMPEIPPAKGAYTLELRDSGNTMAQSYRFDLRKPSSSHGQTFPSTGFRLSIPVPDQISSLVISGPGGQKATVKASPNKPTVSASAVPGQDKTARTLQWTARDADGDALTASVYLRGDEGDWYGVASDLTANQLAIPASNLPAAKSARAMVIVSDGFNSASAEVDLGAGAPLSVLAATPADGATDVERMPGINAWLTNPLQVKGAGPDSGLVDLPSGQFSLSDAKGKPVPAEAGYLAASRTITLTPKSPLEPDSQYRVTVQGLKDRFNNSLGKPYSWSFRTGPREVDPDDNLDPDAWLPKNKDLSDLPIIGSSASPVGSAPARNQPLKQKQAQPQKNTGYTTPAKSSTSDACSCECDQRASADDLCELFCEDEFAACKKP